MKQIKTLFFAIAMSLAVLTGCEKEGNKQYYSYDTEFKIHDSTITGKCETTEINNALNSRLNKLFEFTEEEAEAEWNSFISSIDESKISFTEGSYYTVRLNVMKIQGEKMVVDKVFKEKKFE